MNHDRHFKKSELIKKFLKYLLYFLFYFRFKRMKWGKPNFDFGKLEISFIYFIVLLRAKSSRAFYHVLIFLFRFFPTSFPVLSDLWSKGID